MAISDRWVKITTVGLLVLHLTVLVLGYVTHQLLYFITVLNLVVGAAFLLFWLQKYMRITKHIFERREMIVLGMEIGLTGCALHALVTNGWNNGMWIGQYLFFGLHFLALALFLGFMFTFKMKKLI